MANATEDQAEEQADGAGIVPVTAVEHIEEALRRLDVAPVGVLGTVVLDRDAVQALRHHLNTAIAQITEVTPL